MITQQELLQEFNQTLTPEEFSDYAPNGLQVAGSDKISTLISGVTANQALIDAAIKNKADAILVHHGFFWRGEDPCVVGIKKKRLQALLAHDINLFAYHLPLDAHNKYGNNAELARLLQLQSLTPFAQIGVLGLLADSCQAVDFSETIANILGRQPLYVGVNSKKALKKIAICSGAASSFIVEAIAAGVDAYITGEAAENTVHLARESGVDLFVCGHHATERYGVQALAAYVATKFGLKHKFVDVDSPL